MPTVSALTLMLSLKLLMRDVTVVLMEMPLQAWRLESRGVLVVDSAERIPQGEQRGKKRDQCGWGGCE